MQYSSSIIVVGPREFARRLANLGTMQVVSFDSLEDLDRWRERQRLEQQDETLLPDVLTALREIGCTLDALPRKLQKTLECIAGEECVPPVSAIETQWGSRRSFYRLWSEHISEPPSTFFRRIRVAQALRFIDGGMSRKEAAHRAGFTSVAQLRHSMRR